MRIAIFHNVPPGGAKRVILEELKYLRRKGIATDLYSYKKDDDPFFDLKRYSSESFYYNFELKKETHGLGRLLKDLALITSLKNISRKIAADIDKKNYDVLLVHPDLYTQAPYVLRFVKTPKIYFCQELIRSSYERLLDVDPDLPLPNYLYEKALRTLKKYIDRTNAQKADTILTASKYIKNKVKNTYKKDAKIVKLGVDTKVFRPSKTKDLKTVTYVGDKEVISGYFFAKKVVGSNIIKSRYKFNVVSRKKGNLRLNDREISKILAESFLVLCTSYNEPFGLTVVESMACGTPVLAVNDGGYLESVKDGVTGYLLPRNERLFAEKINELSVDNKLYKKMSVNCVKHVKKSWAWEGHGSKIVSILKRNTKSK